MDPNNPNPNPGPGGAFAGSDREAGFGNPSWSPNEDRPPQHHTPVSHTLEHETQAGLTRVKGSAAQALHAVADVLRTRTEGAGGQFAALTDYGRQASDLLGRAARYVDEMDMDRLQARLEDSVRRNPARSLLIAGAVGLVLGASIRRR